jgi:hypothetical protein
MRITENKRRFVYMYLKKPAESRSFSNVDVHLRVCVAYTLQKDYKIKFDMNDENRIPLTSFSLFKRLPSSQSSSVFACQHIRIYIY